jgi:hypothetical protein
LKLIKLFGNDDENENKTIINSFNGNKSISSNRKITNKQAQLSNNNQNSKISTNINNKNNDELSYREIHANKLIRQINDIYNQNNSKIKVIDGIDYGNTTNRLKNLNLANNNVKGRNKLPSVNFNKLKS